MRSSSTSGSRPHGLATLAAAAMLALALAPSSVQGADATPDAGGLVVGLLRSRDAEVDRDLEDGVRLGFDRAAAAGGRAVQVRRGETVGTWGTAGGSAARLVREDGALALITPPERDVAHLCVQVASKVLAPVVTTSRAPSALQTGSPWVVRVVPAASGDDAALEPPPFDPGALACATFVLAFRERYGREPGPWAVAGHDAARAIAAGLVASRGEGGVALRDALRRLWAVEGATGRFDLDRRGHRLPTCRGVLRTIARGSAALVGGVWSAAIARADC